MPARNGAQPLVHSASPPGEVATNGGSKPSSGGGRGGCGTFWGDGDARNRWGPSETPRRRQEEPRLPRLLTEAETRVILLTGSSKVRQNLEQLRHSFASVQVAPSFSKRVRLISGSQPFTGLPACRLCSVSRNAVFVRRARRLHVPMGVPCGAFSPHRHAALLLS